MTIHITDDERVLIVCAADDWEENAERWRDNDSALADESDRNAATLRELLHRVSLQSETLAIGENPTLTDAEREAVDAAAHAVAQLYVGPKGVAVTATLRSLLERTGG